MLAAPATEDKVKLMVLSVRKGMALAPNATYRGFSRGAEGEVLPIKILVHWSELAGDWLTCFDISVGSIWFPLCQEGEGQVLY